MKLKPGKLYQLNEENTNFLTAFKGEPSKYNTALKDVFLDEIIFYVGPIEKKSGVYYIFLDKDGDKLWLLFFECCHLKEIS